MQFNKVVSPSVIQSQFPQLTHDLMGPLDSKIDNFAFPESATESSFVFANSEKALKVCVSSKAGCILTSDKFKVQAQEWAPEKSWLFSKNVDLAAREIKVHYCLATPFRPNRAGTHSSAVLGEDSVIDPSAAIGPFCVIGKGCRIGANSFLGSHVVVEDNTTIGEDCTLHPFVYIGHSTQIGNNVEIMSNTTIASEGFGYAHDHLGNHYRIPHSGRVLLKDNVHIGSNCSIDRGTLKDSVIGEGTKVDNQVHFAHNLVIGKNGLVTANAVTAGSVNIGDNFACGGITGITGHINITDNVHVAGFSGVTNDVKQGGLYGGHPLVPLQDYLKNQVSLRRLAKIKKRVDQMWSKVMKED